MLFWRDFYSIGFIHEIIIIIIAVIPNKMFYSTFYICINIIITSKNMCLRVQVFKF